MAYKRKTRDKYLLEINYGFGHGWEGATAEDTRAAIKERLREYRENQSYPVRVRKVRQPIT
jgi:hypothetical protein